MSALHETIRRQPDDLRRLMAEGWDSAAHAATMLSDANRVVLTGIGTSYHAAVIGGWLLRAAGLDAVAVHAFDLALYPEQFPWRSGDVAIVQGHTGATHLTRRALDAIVAAGVPVIAIGGKQASHPGATITLRTTEAERTATYTASHLAALTVLAQVATLVWEARGGNAADWRDTLAALPDQVADVLAREAEVAEIAARAVDHRLYAIGAGPNEATATELMIKVREAAFATIDGMAAEQFLHGPMVAFNPGDLLIAIHVAGAGRARVAEIARVAAAVGGEVWAIGDAIEGIGVRVFALPTLPEVLSPLLALIPVQLFASHLAMIRGTNPDEFRMHDPVYHRAFSSLPI